MLLAANLGRCLKLEHRWALADLEMRAANSIVQGVRSRYVRDNADDANCSRERYHT
jgi:hypothetical protein